MDRIMTLHRQMKEVFEATTMLEQRILCKFLPQSFDHLPLPNLNEINVDDCTHDGIQGNQKSLQHLKRSMLDRLIQSYENQLLAYGDQSRKEWNLLGKICWECGIVEGVPLLDFFTSYMANRTKQLKRETHFKMISFRNTLIRHRHRTRTSQTTLGIWPQVLTDMSALPLTNAQISYISSAGKNNIDLRS